MDREREKLHTINNNARRERIRHIKNLNKNKSNSGIKKLSFKRPAANLNMEDDDFNPRHQPMYHNGYVQGNLLFFLLNKIIIWRKTIIGIFRPRFGFTWLGR